MHLSAAVPLLATAGLLAIACGKAAVADAVADQGVRVATKLERFAALPSTADEFERIFRNRPNSTELQRTRAALTRAISDGVTALPAVATSGEVADIVKGRLRAPSGRRS